ncbi:MAG TPA: M15 family metallopeptidase [Bacteroidota bacterium]|nr:M15 family metallopeptidase [Bacteroidota bacterium]
MMPHPHIQLNQVRRTTFALRLCALLAILWQTSLSQAPGDLSLNGRPADVPPQWKRLIGEYSLGTDTISVLERSGVLQFLIDSKQSYHLKPDGNDGFDIFPPMADGSRRCLFRRDTSGDGSSLELARTVYRRIVYSSGKEGSFRINPLKPIEVLRKEALAAAPPQESGTFRKFDLVELTTLDSTIHLDVRYATTNNFMGAQFYSQARAFLQRPAAEALLRAHKALAKLGYGLLIHDAYRPWYVTKMFWDATPERQKDFVANPAKGSRHNRGCAVDLSLYDMKTGEPIEMVSGYDEFSHRAYPGYPGGTSLQRWHRLLLRNAMEAEGFRVFDVEWWHFDYGDWRSYPIGTLTFEQIRK